MVFARIPQCGVLFHARAAISRSMASSSSNSRKVEELRAMSHGQLVQYALGLMSSREEIFESRGLEKSTQNILRRNDGLGQDERNGNSAGSRKRRRAEKPFNMDRFGQRWIALKLCYIGWHFHGFATQPNIKLTVEDHLFSALLRTRLISSREDCAYSRAGRTDVGVSALGQVVGLKVRSNVVSPSTGSSEFDYVTMINSALPQQIRVLCWAPVSDGSAEKHWSDEKRLGSSMPVACDGAQQQMSVEVRRPGAPFSARFDAVHRTYKYFFVKGLLDVAAMRTACKYFVGRHDFRNFCKIDVESTTNFKRVMYEVDVRPLQDDFPAPAVEDDHELTAYYIYIRGQAFLWHQVRCMASVLFEVGKGNEEPEVVKQMLDDASTETGVFSHGKPSYQMAPASPLLLYDCAYPDNILQFSVQVGNGAPRKLGLFRTDAAISGMYGVHAAQSAVLASMLCANDHIPVVRADTVAGTEAESTQAAPFGMIRGPRLLLPTDSSGPAPRNYTPLRKRAREPSVEEKRERLASKKRASTVTKA